VFDDYYANISGNCISSTWMGIQVDNFFQSKPVGASAVISGNTITTHTQDITGDFTYPDVHGIRMNNIYHTPGTWSVTSNSMTHTGSGDREGSRGLELWSIQENAAVTVSANTITDFETGYLLWNNPATAPSVITGGTVSGAKVGVEATNADTYGDAGSSSYVIDGVSIQNSIRAGILVNDSSGNTNNSTVSLAVKNSTIINNTSTGLLISGPDASASLRSNTCGLYRTIKIHRPGQQRD